MIFMPSINKRPAHGSKKSPLLTQQPALVETQKHANHMPKSKYALIPARAEVITIQHVRSLMDCEGI